MTTRARRPVGGAHNAAHRAPVRAVDYQDLSAWAALISEALKGLPPERHERIRDWWSQRVAAHLRVA